MINAILWKLRTGAPWRDLPECYGSWRTAHERRRHWTAEGTWDRTLDLGDRPASSTSPSAATATAGQHRFCSPPPTGHDVHRPSRSDQIASRRAKGSRGGRPPAFAPERYADRNVVEHCFNRLKQFRGLATRYAERAPTSARRQSSCCGG